MTPSEEVLSAYVDGELDAAAHEEVSRLAAADPALAHRIAKHQALRGTLRASFDPVLSEPVPDRLTALLQPSASAKRGNKVVDFRPRSVRQRRWVQWGSIAASFAVIAIVWQIAWKYSPSAPIRERNGEMVASGALASALNGQLASRQDAAASVQIGLSFQSKAGDYCRTFRLQASASAGLACHQQGQWTVQLLERSDVPTGQFRQAASSLSAGVLRAVEASISGDPLDAAAEAQARERGWPTAR